MATERHESAERRDHDKEYWFMNTGEKDEGRPWRRWENCKEYGFLAAGGGTKWIEYAKKLRVGATVFAYVVESGYVGLGIVTAEAVPLKDFVPKGETKLLIDLRPDPELDRERLNDAERWDMCIAVRWINAVDREHGMRMDLSRRGTICRIRKQEDAMELVACFPDEP